MRVCALASGSSGNCFYIENEHSNNNKNAVLIDAGISAKKITERLADVGKNPENIKALFITHEHSDHIIGADVFARKFKVPIFITKKVAKSCFVCEDKELINEIKNNEVNKLIGLEISAFPKSHLGLDPVSYSISDLKLRKKASVITDAGFACKNVIANVNEADFLCFESNYDEKMLENGFYPYHTKKWIKSDKGHLSNVQSAACIVEHGKNKLKHVMLSHISKNNNTPDIALNTCNYFISQRQNFSPKVSLSLREFATRVFAV